VDGRCRCREGGGEDRARLARARPLQIRILPGAYPDLPLVGGERKRVAGTQWESALRCVAALAGVNWQPPDKGQVPSTAGAPGVCLQDVGQCLVYCGPKWLSGPRCGLVWAPVPSAGVSQPPLSCLVASRRFELAAVPLRAERTSTTTTLTALGRWGLPAGNPLLQPPPLRGT
jgi:hypothetical protein